MDVEGESPHTSDSSNGRTRGSGPRSCSSNL